MPPSSEVVATLAVEIKPTEIAAAPDGRRAYVTMFEFGGPDEPDRGAVAVIDTATNAVVATVPAGRSVGIAVARDSRHVYVLQWSPGAVLRVLDAQTHAVVEDVKLARGLPEGLAMTRDGKHLYAIIGNTVENPDRGTVQVIDTATRKVVATLVGNPFPGRAAATPDGRFIYVLNPGDLPTKIDTATHATTFAVDSGGGDRVAFGPDGTLYVADDSFITGLDFTTGRAVAVCAPDRKLTDFAITPDGRLLCATIISGESIAENPVVMFELGTSTPPAHRVSYPGEANAIAIMPDGRSAFIADSRKRTVQRITLAAG